MGIFVALCATILKLIILEFKSLQSLQLQLNKMLIYTLEEGTYAISWNNPWNSLGFTGILEQHFLYVIHLIVFIL